MATTTFYRVTTVRHGNQIVHADVVMEIDLDALAQLIGSDAINNKSNRATLAKGAIRVCATAVSAREATA